MYPRKLAVFARSASSLPLHVAHNSLPSSVSKSSHSSSSRGHTSLLSLELGLGVAACVAVFILFLLVRLLKDKQKQQIRQCPRSSIKLRRFTYSELKVATRGFDNQQKLGQGGFGAVFKGILKGGQEIAVKKLDIASSDQGEREFQNELSVVGHVRASPHIVRFVGFCAHGKRRLLVYEYMHNRSLQEALFEEDNPAQLFWERRFDIMVDSCRALAFLHACEPPIVHGDIKPSNVLLDANFCAKVADFGLARFKTGSKTDCDHEDVACAEPATKLRGPRRGGDKERKHAKNAPVVCTVDAEPELVHHSQQELLMSAESTVRRSVSSVFTTSPDSDASSSIIGKPIRDFSQNSYDGNSTQHDALMSDSADAAASTSLVPGLELDSKDLHLITKNSERARIVSAVCRPMPADSMIPGMEADSKDEHVDVERLGASVGKEAESVVRAWKEKQRTTLNRDWWWRQETSGELSVKDYVMDWMGHESRSDVTSKEITSAQQHKLGSSAKACPDDAGQARKARRGRREQSQSSEMWGGSSQEEGAGHGHSVKGKKRSHQDRPKSREWWKDEEITSCREWKATKKKKRPERSCSREWSGELCSRGVSSTPSMRGTICYIAPENGSNGVVSEKTDVYSFGVLLLVIISGRRPLQVTASPMAEFERANLISWARQLAHSGSVLDLVDPSLRGEFCRKQATLSITVALLCLQRLPSKRPSMDQVLKMLLGEMEAPSLPFQFSPSPPCRVRYRSRRRTLSSDRVTLDMSISS